jgi:hypothetical protein
MGQTAISCTDRKRPGSLPELRLTDLARRFCDSHMKIAHDSNALRILDVFVALSQQTLRVGTIMFLRHMPHLV